MSDAARDVLRTTAHLANTRMEIPMTDTQLLGFIRVAFEEIRLKLVERGHTGVRGEWDLTNVPAAMVILDATSTPPLPTDMVVPLRLWERIAGATNQWQPMLEVKDHLPPNASASDKRVWWEWREGALHFLAASGLTDIRIHGYSRLDNVNMPLDVVGLPDLVNPISFKAASLALAGNEYYEMQYRAGLDTVSNIDVQTKQSAPYRRKRLRRGIRIGRF